MKKTTFAEMVKSSPSSVPELTPAQHQERLMRIALKQFDEGGSQEKVKEQVFPDKESFEKFTKALESFIKKLSNEELSKARVHVTNDTVAHFRLNPVRDDAIVLTSTYTIILERDMVRESPDTLVVRVILNREDLGLKIQNFFSELDFHGVSLKSIDQMIAHMDTHAGITVEQMLFDDFKQKFGSRKDWFEFSEDVYGIFDEGKLILTSSRWNRAVSLKMPSDGTRPWLYRFVKNDEGRRVSASFRVNAYGALWHKPQT